MLDSTQFLKILLAEAEHLVTVSIFLPPDAKSTFERRLNDAFASDSFSDAARAWNEERSRIVQDVLDQHLIPAGIKWTREYIREEVEDYLAGRCGLELRKVRVSDIYLCLVLIQRSASTSHPLIWLPIWYLAKLHPSLQSHGVKETPIKMRLRLVALTKRAACLNTPRSTTYMTPKWSMSSLIFCNGETRMLL